MQSFWRHNQALDWARKHFKKNRFWIALVIYKGKHFHIPFGNASKIIRRQFGHDLSLTKRNQINEYLLNTGEYYSITVNCLTSEEFKKIKMVSP